MTAQDAISLWDASAQEPDYRAPLDGDVSVDVAIVGGGFTGLSTALHCAEKGLSAHVIEAEQIGYGGSGRNVGLVNAALWLPPRKVREQLGDTYGPRFIKRFGKGPEYVFSLIEKHQIRCEVTRTGTIHAAHGPSGFADLQDRHKEWQRLGEPVDLLGRDEVSRLIGTDHFHGGLVDHRCTIASTSAAASGSSTSPSGPMRSLRVKRSSRGTSGLGSERFRSYCSKRFSERISMTSRKPSVVMKASRAPRRSISALVTSVVP